MAQPFSLRNLWHHPFRQLGSGVLQRGFGCRLLRDVHRDTRLAVYHKDVPVPFLNLQFHARLAGDEIAFPQAERAEGIAGNFRPATNFLSLSTSSSRDSTLATSVSAFAVMVAAIFWASSVESSVIGFAADFTSSP